MININTEWQFKEVFPTISAYTTSYNCLTGKYPIEKAIRSFAWADEVVVVDGGSTDGTVELLESLQAEFPNRVKLYKIPLDETNPGKDGSQKGMSRAMCMHEYCVQFDADEIGCGSEAEWRRLAKNMPGGVDTWALPVYEPLGTPRGLRTGSGFNIWKWRISRNKPEFTHSIPDYDRFEVDGKVYSKGQSDGCFPVNVVNNKLLSHGYPGDWFVPELYKQRDTDLAQYKESLEKIFKDLPFVYHTGHVDLKSKIELYLSSWHEWWCLLYNKNPQDPENNQYFPGVLPSDVTGEMIDSKVKELQESEKTIEVESALSRIDMI